MLRRRVSACHNKHKIRENGAKRLTLQAKSTIAIDSARGWSIRCITLIVNCSEKVRTIGEPEK